MKKIGIQFLVLLLLVSVIPLPTSFAEMVDSDYLEEDVVLFSEVIGDEVELFEEVIATDPVLTIPDDSEAVLLKVENENLSLIRYTYEDDFGEEQVIEGYVANEAVVLLTEADDYRASRIKETDIDIDNKGETPFESDSEQINLENDESISDTEEDAVTNDFGQLSVTSLSAKSSIKESATSLLGHINNGNVKIYETIGGSSISAGPKYTNAVYYIKKQATLGTETYYLISTAPSSERGVIGWVNAKDMSTYRHAEVDKKTKTFYIKGTGKATKKAWGGKKDTVYPDLSTYKNAPFWVNLTEVVGNDIWYRGVLDGKTVWVHSKDVNEADINKTSLLGHINNGSVRIHEEIGGKSFQAGSQYTNAVYYIKKQATLGTETYYLISTAPSSERGVIGWVNAKDMSTYRHAEIDKKTKTFYIKGTGKATKKAWGGKKDTVYPDLSTYKNAPFWVNLTEVVGNDIWYRGVLDGKTVWVHSKDVNEADINKTSLLGHINNGSVRIHEEIGGKSFQAGSQYTNAVYYIKAQAKSGNQLYYLISTRPSSERGIVGWVKSTDMKVHPHVAVDKKIKTFYVKGNGKATTKAWGGKKDAVFSDLTKQKNKLFEVHLTEKVGNEIWYRGVLDGKTVWLQSSQVHTPVEVATSRLGHINNGNVNIYKTIGGSSFTAGSTYTNAVYYIKKQAILGNEVYYLISTAPSSERGVVGWVKAADMESYPHTVVDKKEKVFYIKGTGRATTKAWGGKKDAVYSSLTNFSGQLFNVHLTEKVGNSVWYRGTLNGKTVWLHSNYVTNIYTKETDYYLSLNDAVNKQMDQKQMIHKNGKWVAASKEEISYYMNPNNFLNDPRQKFQFLDLSKPSGASVNILNDYLRGKGTLNGQGKTFYDAARKYGINDVYLIAHAQLETGRGTSALAKGIKVGRAKDGRAILVTKSNEKELTNIKTVYNMFGIGAVDGDANAGGAKMAYEQGWDTPTKAVDGGALWISKQYIQNAHNQNTLYKMKWNPRMHEGYAWKQYATDIAWASKQVDTIYTLYREIGLTDTLSFDIPKFR